MYRIVFSDIDGTLLNSEHVVTPATRDAILALHERDIPFVIVSARSPSGIYPIVRANDLQCAIVSYSGALMMDERGQVLHSQGFSRETAREVIDFAEREGLPLAWNLYSGDDWIVRDRTDPRVAREESIVEACAREGSVDSLAPDAPVHKILCICEPGTVEAVEVRMHERFGNLAVVKSSNILLEIMHPSVDKAASVQLFCERAGIDTAEAIAFGDNYNDVGMLEAVGRGVVMGNAPADILARFEHITADNDHDGIARELERVFGK